MANDTRYGLAGGVFTTDGARGLRVVRELRAARGWSQERLAGRAELNRSYMGEVERAAVVPSLTTAAKLAQAFGVPLSQLIARCERSRDP